jgi:hypothetical protein
MAYNPQDYYSLIAQAMGGTNPNVAPVNAGDQAEGEQVPAYILEALKAQQAQQQPAPDTPLGQAMVPQAPDTPLGQAMGPQGAPQQPQAPQQQPGFLDRLNGRGDSASIYDGLINGGAAMLGAKNLKEGLAANITGFNDSYDAKTAKDKLENTPKVTDVAGGAFASVQLPGKMPVLMYRSQVANYLTQQKIAEGEAKGNAIVLQARVGQAVAAGKKADELEATHAGDAGQAASNIKELRDIAGELQQTDSATGPIVGSLPKGVRDVVTPSGSALQDRAERVIQAGLRNVLGAQYTENEGKSFMARAYNPRLSEAENARRVLAAADEMEQLAKDKQGAIDYFRSKGTLDGFRPSATPGSAPQTTQRPSAAPAGGVRNEDATAAEMRRRGFLK